MVPDLKNALCTSFKEGLRESSRVRFPVFLLEDHALAFCEKQSRVTGEDRSHIDITVVWGFSYRNINGTSQVGYTAKLRKEFV